MDTTQEVREDPLVAALPPATDYITYLTLLEYQLTPQNLPTLNRLLSEDDGTLASEIGWDLLKLVLPMLQIVPAEANKCLSTIARRGNPREVVVRVAEELERLGQREDVEDESEQDELPTFAGEAPRIHLGEMKLEGMPPEAQTSARRTSVVVEDPESGTDNILILQALLSMLSVLHPRIKTQYPSRFLATSLPAALGAYRRMQTTPETTLAFLDFLTRMSGKQRPNLPPRTSTASGIPMTAGQPVPTTTPSTAQAVPLPDPEAKTDPSANTTDSLANEKAITQRLLQAVMLEVLDEFTSDFQTTDFPTMAWTLRLREKHEPRRVLPGRPTETQRWTQSAELKSRDNIVAKFLKLSKDLELNIASAINELTDASTSTGVDATTVDPPDSDYPTSPLQIPFPKAGLIVLYAAQSFAQDITGLTSMSGLLLSLSSLEQLFLTAFTPSGDITAIPSLSEIDALLSLIYTALQPAITPVPPPTPTSATTAQIIPPLPPSTTVDLPFLTNLTNLFVTSPDTFTRDSAHHLTTLLLHHHTKTEVKLLYIKSLLSPQQSPASPIHDIQQGNLRSLALNWLKDEFLAYTPPPPPPSSSTQAQQPQEVPPPPPQPTTANNSSTTGLNPNLITTDPDLLSLVFPQIPSIPSPFITSHPPSSSSLPTETDLETLLLQLPAFTSSLNLLYVLSNLSHHQQTTTTTPGGEFSVTAAVIDRASEFIRQVEGWKEFLVGLVDGIARKKERDGEEGEGELVNVGDVYALEDALGRARVGLEGWER